MISFPDFFRIASGGYSPYPYQERLAKGAPLVLNIPTGLGKTLGILVGWLYRRYTDPNNTPCRLMYQLPMRTLVEQTFQCAKVCLDRLAAADISFDDLPGLEIVMGGDIGENWYRNPERPYIVIGTQDLLLSRALNRGYAMNRFAWPMAFGAANTNCYWALDEVQLQEIGAVTAAQLHAFRRQLGTFGPSELTLLSATIDPEWFETADFTLADAPTIGLEADDLQHAQVDRIRSADKTLYRANLYEPKEIAAFVAQKHRPGTQTIIIVNRVERAQDIYRELLRAKNRANSLLLHSRFRPAERNAHLQKLQAVIDPDGPGRIIVATQVIEAGVDITCSLMITDVAPWPSMIQRFGRCNRAGADDGATAYWLAAGDTGKAQAAPYEEADITAAREILLAFEGKSIAAASLPSLAMPLRSGLVLRKPDLLDLFDTALDLAGHDVDVSPYIRDADDISVQVFWRPVKPGEKDIPQRDELCPIPISGLRKILDELQKADKRDHACVQNQFAKKNDEAWTVLTRDDIRPGLVVWFHPDVMYYDHEFGFSKGKTPVAEAERDVNLELLEECTADSDALSATGKAITLAAHSTNAHTKALELTQALNLSAPISKAVATAALWHDVGKAHAVFQETMHRGNLGIGDGSEIWAKCVSSVRHSVRGFRHELPSALAYLQHHRDQPDTDLIAFLIAAHHGKMRMTAIPLPYEADAQPRALLGTHEGELLPALTFSDLLEIPQSTLTLHAFQIGSSNDEPTWVERTTALRDDPQLGPFRLSFLELTVRLADIRASREEQLS